MHNDVGPIEYEVRTFPSRLLTGGVAAGAGILLSKTGLAKTAALVDYPIKEYDINVNGITIHVAEQGEGAAVLFCHGFPDTGYTWRQQMKAVSAAGFRAIAPDMRGYGRSSAPTDPNLYTPFHTAGDLIGVLHSLKVPTAIIVGHGWSARVAWNAALMRPDRQRMRRASASRPKGQNDSCDGSRFQRCNARPLAC